MGAVEFREVTKRFGDIVAVNKLSLTVDKGRTVCLFGPSGCGKTTVLRLIAGLEGPDSGTILLDGKKASGNGVHVFPAERNVGMVFQDLALWPHKTVAGHLNFILRAKHSAKKSRQERINAILGKFQLLERCGAYPNELSGGQQQRLAIARALAGDPEVLLLDEPFASLDDDLRLMIIDDLIRLREEMSLTIVFATHDRGEVSRLGDTVLRMRDGEYELTDIEAFQNST